MKLKYYMRGLGIGIILTTLILTISNPRERMTDSEIKERAKALGMVDEEEASLSEVLENSKSTPPPSISPSITPEPTALPETSVTPAPTKAPDPTKAPTPEPTREPIVTPADESPKEDISSGQDGLNSGELVTFTIERGMSSGKVAAMLVDKGIIKDAEDFNQYIVSEGKASVIRVGTYTLPKKVTYEEIVNKITTK